MRQISNSPTSSAIGLAKDAPLDPVFVVGCQRSGTTLLGSMIGGHPQVITIPEAQFVVDLMPDADPSREHRLSSIIDAISRHWRFKIWGFDLDGRRPPPTDDVGTYADAIRWLVRAYASEHRRSEPFMWIDHQPGHGQFLTRLHRHFPGLKAIHVVRDGRAVAASLLPLDWGPNEIHSAAYFWEQRLAWCLAAAEFLGRDRMMWLRYEDIVREPKSAMRRVAEFLQIPFYDDMLLGTGLAVPAFTTEQHRLVGSMPDPSRIDDWRQRLTPRQVEIFEATTGDLLTYFGYTLLAGANPRPISYREKVTLTARGQLKTAWNARRFRRRQKQFGGAN